MSDHYNLGFLHASRHMPVDAPAKPRRAFEEYSAGYADGVSERPVRTFDSNGHFIGVVTLNEVKPAAVRPLDATFKAKRGVKPEVDPVTQLGFRTHKPVTLATREAKVSRRQKGITAALSKECLTTREAELRELEKSLHLREQELAKREAQLTRQIKQADARAKEALASQRYKQLNRLRKLRTSIIDKYTEAKPAPDTSVSTAELLAVQEATRTTHVSHHICTLTRVLNLLSDLDTLPAVRTSEEAIEAIGYAHDVLDAQLDGLKEIIK